jgi:hypothetical protein
MGRSFISTENVEIQDDEAKATWMGRSFGSTENVDPQDDDAEASSLDQHHFLSISE